MEKIDPSLFGPLDAQASSREEIKRPVVSYWKGVYLRLLKNKLASFGFMILVVLILMAIFGPYMNQYDYISQHLDQKNMKPGGIFWFGSDQLGRDIFTRAWYGARISLIVGIMAAFIDLIMGILYGGASGYLGGKWDNIMMRIAEILYSIPYLLMAIFIKVILPPNWGSGLFPMLLAITITGWIPMARLIRGQVLQIKEMEYVTASRASGAKFFWILRKHLIPNAFGPILVNVTLTIPRAIFAEATLSFLGLGISAPLASWGTMTSDSVGSILVGNGHQLFFPAILISLTMFGFNVFGDGLRDALDPRTGTGH